MENCYFDTVTVTAEDSHKTGKLKLSALLRFAQEVSGKHSDALGFSWDNLMEKGLFWAVLRHRVVIHRLPETGETVNLQTWPMPTTRSAYPRAVRARDGAGNVLFEVMSLWVLMDVKTRMMVLPGKSDVNVPGILLGDEITSPGSLPPLKSGEISFWQVDLSDTDINGHVNNARYLDKVQPLLSARGICTPKEFTVCYLSEALPGQEISLCSQVSDDGIFSLDGHRKKTDVSQGEKRVFALRLHF
jgi:acyl-ACP thioesterase